MTIRAYNCKRTQLNRMDTITEIITKYEAEGVISPLFHKSQLIEDSRELLRLGFWPRVKTVTDTYIMSYLKYEDRLSDTSPLRDDTVEAIKNATMWYYVPLKVLRKDCESFAIKHHLLAARDSSSMYKSGRPKTTMSNFRTPNSRECPLSSIVDGRLDGWLVIPVTRYGPRARRTLYFDNNDRPGIFYNYEPESTVFLPYKKACSAANKTAALQVLLVELSRRNSPFINSKLKNRIYNELTRDLLQQKGIAHYARDPVGLCGDEVDLDRLLCDLATVQGYDIIILEEFNEILSTLSTDASFASLIYTY